MLSSAKDSPYFWHPGQKYAVLPVIFSVLIFPPQTGHSPPLPRWGRR